MKVLHVIPSISGRGGGPSQAILPMCRALREKAVDLLLATTDAGLSAENGKVSIQRQRITAYHGQPTIFFPSQIGASFKYSRSFANWLNKNVAQFDVVHIHAVFNHASIAAAHACREMRVPYIVRPLGTLDPWSMKQKPLRKRVFWYGGIKRMLTGAARIHYTAKSEQQAVEESLNLNHGVVVPLGVDMKEKDNAGVKDSLPGQFSFLPKSPYVLVLSRLVPTKGLDVLLEAFLRFVKRKGFEEYRLIVAGEGPPQYVKSLKKIIDDRGIPQVVAFTGWLEGEAKDAALRNASLLALPSHHENFGLCVMESLGCGVPVLVSPHVNLAPEIQAFKAGWVAAVDREAIEVALVEALGSEPERMERGANGRRLARNYAWPAIADRLVDLYATVLKEHCVADRVLEPRGPSCENAR